MKKSLYLLLPFILSVHTIAAQHFFENISKNGWKGTGTLLQSEASFQMRWQPVLDGTFYQLTFQNQINLPETPAFKAIAMYHIENDSTVTGTWFDSRGFSFPLRGSFTDTRLTVYWGTPEIEEGKTVYLMNVEGTVGVTDHIQKNGDLVLFGDATYSAHD